MKKDVFGKTLLFEDDAGKRVRRDAREASFGVRWVARRLLAREARSLAVLEDLGGVPELLRADRDVIDRGYIDGMPMQEGRPADIRYFHEAARLLRSMHRMGVVHNDLAKEPNLLVTAEGRPAIIDYQLSWFAPRRGRLFRILAREDIRHLLKHKKTYCPADLTQRELSILESPSVLARIWMATGKPVYLFVTRRIMGWKDREGAGDRV